MTNDDSEELDEKKSFVEQDVLEKYNIGTYIGDRNTKGERNGRGWAILPNGDQYDGEYRKGQRHGIGLYVFKDGSRYFGQYRCGIRSGRGIFIYTDGSYYEGAWHKNLKHGKGRYSYSNGDTYCGNSYRGQRHGVGIYTIRSENQCIRFTGTWRQGVRVGPFQLSFGCDNKCTSLYGIWDNLYPQGPSVFNFNNRYLLLGYFQATVGEASLSLQAGKETQPLGNFTEEITEIEESDRNPQDTAWFEEPSLWYAQYMCTYDISLLPQEPVPLPISDSDISVCSTITEISLEKSFPTAVECESEAEVGKEETEMECFHCESSSSGAVESFRQMCSPCDIDISVQKIC